MTATPCLGCQREGRLNIVTGGKCDRHRAADRQKRDTQRRSKPTMTIYKSSRWVRLSETKRREWIRVYGFRCPGWPEDHGWHEATDLTADHTKPLAEILAQGGDPFDEAEIGILCRACNGRKGAN